MQFGAQQRFTLTHPGTPAEALAWAQAPGRALVQVDFLQDVQLSGAHLSGELRVPVPLLGEITLPFVSRLDTAPSGASLTPQPLPERRGWVEVSGQATVGEPAPAGGGTPVELSFDFQAFLRLPDSGNLGGAAFEKMVRATAQRTIERVLVGLPEQLQASMGQ
ncbi:hypothetical protein Deipr_0254 [Deinococcus proteolyticus MRP]|uniref:Carbon monoxide dehydrogenase subunit G n=2 Tax=Deinococcus proteolyticus TaxID=55148 RepID=F0RJ19_DEIPM|nr:DUF3809 domain-containing protein [Deinococcus sp. SL84]ADY25427.1 hypothetical protein Deipr_0254 [Deinococcus proteolyticus MRP]MCY1701551.1 DUF3809 domain-containing protein [Deinococcus sp. SL84]